MSEKTLRRRIPANRRATTNTRAPRPSPSPASRRRSRPAAGGQFVKSSKNVKILKRSKSEPSLWKTGDGETEMPAAETVTAAEEEQDDGVLYRPKTCTDIFTSPEILTPLSPRKCPEGYKKDAKVVVNVTVEGSPGPIRTLVKLGCNVEEMITFVIKKYNEEGRTPRMDKDSASKFDLHHSYFSLDRLRKSDFIGDIGSRSFYLRKSRAENISDCSNQDFTATTNQLAVPSRPFLPSFVDRKLKKIIQRMTKFWKFFGCIPCIG